MPGRERLLGVVAAVIAVVVLVGCTTADDEPQEARSGFAPAAHQLVASRSEIVGHPDPSRWDVQVARVDPRLPEMVVRRDLPADPPAGEAGDAPAVDVDDEGAAVQPTAAAAPRRATSDATIADHAPGPDLSLSATPHPGAEYLTPIPSPGLSWGSRQDDEGWAFTNPTRIGSPLVFLVVEERGDWLRVQLPTRPNQQTGWIPKDDVTIETHRWHAEVNVTTNRLRVWNGDDLEVDTAVVAGTQYTPTPLGRFYINEKQKTDPWSPYGSWILSTNGFSDSLERFGGEVPIFALHGTPYPETVGQDLSNGCIRMPNDIVEYLATHMPSGTPVDVVA